MAGEMVRARARASGSRLIPVDSEHSALWQCLRGEDPASVRRLVLTASGGPFRERPLDTLALVSVGEALHHPNWVMGPKITVDSATMMNKGLEIIEAHFLFDVAYSRIDVVIHPPSIVHSCVEFCDGATVAQLGIPDMRVPIALALSGERVFNVGLLLLALFHQKCEAYAIVRQRRKIVRKARALLADAPAEARQFGEIADQRFGFMPHFRQQGAEQQGRAQ